MERLRKKKEQEAKSLPPVEDLNLGGEEEGKEEVSDSPGRVDIVPHPDPGEPRRPVLKPPRPRVDARELHKDSQVR